MTIKELKKMSEPELRKRVASLKKELFDLKLSVASTHVKDNSQFKKLRVDIARTLTLLNSNVKEQG